MPTQHTIELRPLIYIRGDLDWNKPREVSHCRVVVGGKQVASIGNKRAFGRKPRWLISHRRGDTNKPRIYYDSVQEAFAAFKLETGLVSTS